MPDALLVIAGETHRLRHILISRTRAICTVVLRKTESRRGAPPASVMVGSFGKVVLSFFCVSAALADCLREILIVRVSVIRGVVAVTGLESWRRMVGKPRICAHVKQMV